MSEHSTTANRVRVTSRFGAASTALEVVEGINLSGRTAVVTGGASGLGIETARALAKARAQVTLAVRNVASGEEVAAKINAEWDAPLVSVAALDLGSLASIREFAKRWTDTRPLSILINNAGIMACPQGTTQDGFETQFGTNHLGHFLLTTLLTPALKLGAPSRVVSLSSSGHAFSDIDFEDTQFRHREYRPFLAYGQSKTANALFAVEYDRRYRAVGIRAFSVMPGVIATPLMRHMTPELYEEIKAGNRKEQDQPRSAMTYKTPEQGAATSVWAAVAPELDGLGGLYLEDCAQALPVSAESPRGKGVMAHALNPLTATRLWEISEKYVGA